MTAADAGFHAIHSMVLVRPDKPSAHRADEVPQLAAKLDACGPAAYNQHAQEPHALLKRAPCQATNHYVESHQIGLTIVRTSNCYRQAKHAVKGAILDKACSQECACPHAAAGTQKRAHRCPPGPRHLGCWRGSSSQSAASVFASSAQHRAGSAHALLRRGCRTCFPAYGRMHTRCTRSAGSCQVLLSGL